MPGFNRAALIGDAQELRGTPRRRLEDRGRGHPELVHEIKFAEVVAVGRDAGIGAHGNANAGLDRVPDRLGVAIDERAGLLENRLGDRGAGGRSLQYAAWCDERRHEPCAVRPHQVDPLVIEEDPVLDRADASSNRVLDSVRGLCVGHHEHPRSGGLLDEDIELERPKMRVRRIVAR